MGSDERLLLQALWLLDDWFHRMGGAGRYPEFVESDIALAVVMAVGRRAEIRFPVQFVAIEHRVRHAAAPIMDKVMKDLDLIDGDPPQIKALLRDFVDYAESKLQRIPNERSRDWADAVTLLRSPDG